MKIAHLRWEMAGAAGWNFIGFPNVRICPVPFGNGYHRLGVIDSPEFHHRSRRDARPCVSTRRVSMQLSPVRFKSRIGNK